MQIKVHALTQKDQKWGPIASCNRVEYSVYWLAHATCEKTQGKSGLICGYLEEKLDYLRKSKT